MVVKVGAFRMPARLAHVEGKKKDVLTRSRDQVAEGRSRMSANDYDRHRQVRLGGDGTRCWYDQVVPELECTTEEQKKMRKK
eukprot:3938200-Rhodomonas_salina.1